MKTKLSGFVSGEAGAGTAMGLVFLITMIGAGGLALDVSNAMMMRTRLQVAADSTAHAALVARNTKTETEAKTIALDVASSILSPAMFGDALNADDIVFGKWDEGTLAFTASSGSKTAVRVNTQRLAERNNSVGTFFLRFAGFDAWDIRDSAVFETYRPTCFREGFVANAPVDVQSNNDYDKGFCIHSNDYVSVNQGNTFASNVIVSMPDINDLVLPNSGFTGNDGLEAALRDGAYIIRVLALLSTHIESFKDPVKVRDATSVYYRPYITSTTVSTLANNVSQLKNGTSWTPGKIHLKTCSGNGNTSISIPAHEVLENGILVTNCEVNFGAFSQLHNVVIATTNLDANSLGGAANVSIGLDDGCKDGGDAQLLTMGGVNFPADLELYGGQIIAAGDVDFAARADGVEGASIIAGGHIEGTSLMDMGFCGGEGMANNFEVDYFRLVD